MRSRRSSAGRGAAGARPTTTTAVVDLKVRRAPPFRRAAPEADAHQRPMVSTAVARSEPEALLTPATGAPPRAQARARAPRPWIGRRRPARRGGTARVPRRSPLASTAEPQGRRSRQRRAEAGRTREGAPCGVECPCLAAPVETKSKPTIPWREHHDARGVRDAELHARRPRHFFRTRWPGLPRGSGEASALGRAAGVMARGAPSPAAALRRRRRARGTPGT